MGAKRTPIRAIKAKKNKIKVVSRPWNKPKGKTILAKKKGAKIKQRVLSKKAGARRIKRYNKK